MIIVSRPKIEKLGLLASYPFTTDGSVSNSFLASRDLDCKLLGAFSNDGEVSIGYDTVLLILGSSGTIVFNYETNTSTGLSVSPSTTALEIQGEIETITGVSGGQFIVDTVAHPDYPVVFYIRGNIAHDMSIDMSDTSGSSIVSPYMQIVDPGFPITNEFTIGAYVKFGLNTNPINDFILFGQPNGAWPSLVSCVKINRTNGYVNFFVGDGTDTIQGITDVLHDNSYHHIVVTYSSDGETCTLYLYVDGFPDATTTVGSKDLSNPNSFYIGGLPVGGVLPIDSNYSANDMVIRNLKIYNKALSEDDILLGKGWAVEPIISAFPSNDNASLSTDYLIFTGAAFSCANSNVLIDYSVLLDDVEIFSGSGLTLDQMTTAAGGEWELGNLSVAVHTVRLRIKRAGESYWFSDRYFNIDIQS